MSTASGPRILVPVPWVNWVRNFMRDKPHINDIIEGVEHTDYQITEAIIEAVDEYNGMTPNGSQLDINIYNLSTINRSIRRFIQRLAVIILLESVSMEYRRNEVSTPSGSIQENIKDKWRNYDSAIRDLRLGSSGSDGVMAQIQAYKRSVNRNMIYNSVHTDLYYPYRGTLEYIEIVS